MSTTNKMLAEARGLSHQECPRCRRRMPAAELNLEGGVHHGRPPECLDRKACERARRKAERKTSR